MSDKWLNTKISADSGILRKAKPQHTATNVEELLVFGYACKIFRDNERARHIDHGKHLIPWMGDNTMKIDRLIHTKNYFAKIKKNLKRLLYSQNIINFYPT